MTSLLKRMFIDPYQCRKRRLVYLSATLRGILYNIANFAIPLFLYDKGFSLVEIGIFLSVEILMMAILFPFACKLSAYVGLRSVYIFAGLPAFAVFLAIMNNLDIFGSTLTAVIALSACMSIAEATYWAWYHGILSVASSKENRGNHVNMSSKLTFIVGILTPLLVGFLITSYGDRTLVYFMSGLLFMTFLMILLSDKATSSPPVKEVKFTKIFKSLKKPYLWHFTLFGIMMPIGIIWPVMFFASSLNSWQKIGAFTSISYAASALIVLVIGELTNVNRKIGLFIASICALVGGLSLHLGYQEALYLMVAAIAWKIMSKCCSISYESITYDHMTQKGNDKVDFDFLIARDIPINMGRILSTVAIIALYDESMLGLWSVSIALAVLLGIQAITWSLHKG